MNAMHNESTSTIKLCRGSVAGQCPFALSLPDSFSEHMERIIEESDWDSFLRSVASLPLKAHEKLRIHVSCCPNGCSQPHIADIGIILISKSVIESALCTGCMECEKACPDQAISVDKKGPSIDGSKCLQCGICSRVCPTGSLASKETTYKLLLGGHLGRHPRLGLLAGNYSLPELKSRILKTIHLFKRHCKEHSRFGDAITQERINELKKSRE